jgi:hypothetical protein
LIPGSGISFSRIILTKKPPTAKRLPSIKWGGVPLCWATLLMTERKEMTRNLKALGLALVAVFAMGAVIASAAQAQQGTLTSTGPVTLRGVNEAGQVNALTAFGSEVKCPNALYTGHKYLETPHKFLTNGATTVTITPHYGTGCTGPLGVPATVDMNGCDYDFHILETTGGGDTYGIRAFITCPKDVHISITFFSSKANHEANKPFCHTVITENPLGYLGLHVTDLTTGHLTVSGTIENITAHKVDGGFFCPEETDTKAKLDLSINVEGRNEAGATTKISLSHP